ncbi:hypothetical protein C5167_041309 [Papaver somniferum]|uniref:Hydroxyproline-rich glycoprotein family protein n=1 Tax=Papaver somniferum TaxID=3469 RepID=A0A4Y7ILQ0_PAPSO|nr:uncharacterized protein At5g65660-like [Papaver somniferum]RZC48378.1 hypothetical protein C5167_041309 [Papaver somniferum]
MENHQVAVEGGMIQNKHADASRPSLGFPLGTALLLIFIFSLSGFFSCCYHWDKLRSLRRSFPPEEEDTDLEANNSNIQSPSSKPSQIYPNWKQSINESMPVIMPGDKIAKFIALPCPCEPYRPDKVFVEVENLQQTPPPPQPQTLVYNHVARFGVYYNG